MKKVHVASTTLRRLRSLVGGNSPKGHQTYFIPGEPNSNLLRVLVRNAVLPMIGLHSLAMEKAPLRCGIASFSRRSEFVQ